MSIILPLQYGKASVIASEAKQSYPAWTRLLRHGVYTDERSVPRNDVMYIIFCLRTKEKIHSHSCQHSPQRKNGACAHRYSPCASRSESARASGYNQKDADQFSESL